LWHGVVMGGRLIDGNSAGVPTWAEQRRGIGGGGRGKGADRRVLVVSDCGALVVTSWQAGSRMEMGRSTVEAGRRRGKWAVKPFPF
jgi:hypothetical protein